jgi:hypothetical protein
VGFEADFLAAMPYQVVSEHLQRVPGLSKRNPCPLKRILHKAFDRYIEDGLSHMNDKLDLPCLSG